MGTLWDFLEPILPASLRRGAKKQARAEEAKRALAESAKAKKTRGRSATGRPAREPMSETYETMTRTMLARYGVSVRRWRSSMSGVAWELRYRDGSVKRLIESPKPKGPMSAAVFLHEIGHHAIGLGAYKPRCLEEYHAWVFAIRAMEEHKLNVTEAVHRRMRRSLEYAVGKAQRRGIRELPAELHAYVPKPRGS